MGKHLSGFAIRFGELSVDLGGFTEIVDAHALDDTLAARDRHVIALVGHDHNMPLGREAAHTLELELTGRGLRFSLSLPDTTYAHDLAASVSRLDTTGMSFDFRVLEDTWEDWREGVVRVLHKLELYEVSATCCPAYPTTTIALRSSADVGDEVGDFWSDPETISRYVQSQSAMATV